MELTLSSTELCILRDALQTYSANRLRVTRDEQYTFTSRRWNIDELWRIDRLYRTLGDTLYA